MHVLYNLHRHRRGYAGLRARVQHFHTHEKKPVGLRIKPVPTYKLTPKPAPYRVFTRGHAGKMCQLPSLVGAQCNTQNCVQEICSDFLI
jgi:hypothetical protein